MNRFLGAVDDAVVSLIRQAGRRDVNRLLEIRALERVGLVENRENAQLAPGEQCFDGNFRAGNVALDEQAVGFRLALDLHFRAIREAFWMRATAA